MANRRGKKAALRIGAQGHSTRRRDAPPPLQPPPPDTWLALSDDGPASIDGPCRMGHATTRRGRHGQLAGVTPASHYVYGPHRLMHRVPIEEDWTRLKSCHPNCVIQFAADVPMLPAVDISMTPDEFAAARKRVGRTQQELAVFLDVSEPYIRKLESGAKPISRIIELAMIGVQALHLQELRKTLDQAG